MEQVKPKVILVNPPKDREEQDYYTEFLPLNLIALYTRLKLAEIDVEIIDSLPGTREIDDIIAKIEGVREKVLIIGISLYQSTYENTIKLAEYCKKMAADTNKKIMVVIGGVNTSLFGEMYMQMHGDILDGAIKGHGEDALIALAQGKKPSNLVTVEEVINGTNVKPNYNTDLDLGFPYDYSALNLENYWQFGEKMFSGRGSRFNVDELNRPLLINTHRGCYLSCETSKIRRKCIFCGQREYNWSAIDPTKFWEVLKEVMEETGANSISDLGDNFVGNKEWFMELIKNKPKDFKYPFKYVFASSDMLCDEDIVRALAEKLNLHAVLNSIEHGDEDCQRMLGKRYTSEQTAKSLRLLEEYQIASRLSFVIGAPKNNSFSGESEKTLANFVEFAKKIAERKCIQLILGNVLEPSPGSKVYHMMMKSGNYRAKYKELMPRVDQKLMASHYFEQFTQISFDRAVESMTQIMNLFPDEVIKGETV